MAKKNKKELCPARSDVEVLLERWGIALDSEILILALSHRSFAHEAGISSNERLEFLGDSVLSIIVTERVYRNYPEVSESTLTKMHHSMVSQEALAQVAREIGLGEFILLGKGEQLSGGRDRDSILCDTFEAMIGATYLSYGLEPTRQVVEALLANMLADVVQRGASMDWKTTLQERAGEFDFPVPSYEVEGSGPDHDRSFTATVYLGYLRLGSGSGKAKKTAERYAAEEAVARLGALETDALADLCARARSGPEQFDFPVLAAMPAAKNTVSRS